MGKTYCETSVRSGPISSLYLFTSLIEILPALVDTLAFNCIEFSSTRFFEKNLSDFLYRELFTEIKLMYKAG